MKISGRMSTFGGPNDMGVGPHEGLALVNRSNFHLVEKYFLPYQPAGITEMLRKII